MYTIYRKWKRWPGKKVKYGLVRTAIDSNNFFWNSQDVKCNSILKVGEENLIFSNFKLAQETAK